MTRALFERAGARDSAGLEAEAEPLYRGARGGLDEDHRTQAVIQLASTLRNLGASTSARLLRAEYDAARRTAARRRRRVLRARAGVDGDAVAAASIALKRSPRTCRATRARWRLRDDLLRAD